MTDLSFLSDKLYTFCITNHWEKISGHYTQDCVSQKAPGSIWPDPRDLYYKDMSGPRMQEKRERESWSVPQSATRPSSWSIAPSVRDLPV